MSITLDHVSFSYGGDSFAVTNLSFSAENNELLLVVGPNGAGKSTLLKLLNGLFKPTSGTVTVNGRSTRTTPTSTLAKEICVTFQNPADQIFASTVRDELAFAPMNLRRSDVDRLVQSSAELFGLTPVLSSHPYNLSPAQRKLLAAASSVSSGASILALDEPTAGLSQPERVLLLSTLKTIRQNRTLLIVSHDLNLFLPLATRVLALHRGEIVFEGSPGRFIRHSPEFRRLGFRLPIVMRLEHILNSIA